MSYRGSNSYAGGGGGGSRKRRFNDDDDDQYTHGPGPSGDGGGGYGRGGYGGGYGRGGYGGRGYGGFPGGGGGGHQRFRGKKRRSDYSEVKMLGPRERFMMEIWRMGEPEEDPSSTTNTSSTAPPQQQAPVDTSQAAVPKPDMTSLARSIRLQWNKDAGSVYEMFRIAATELPHKTPYLASLLYLLSIPASQPITTITTTNQNESREKDVLLAGPVPAPSPTAAGDGIPNKPVGEGDGYMYKEGGAGAGSGNIGKRVVEYLVKVFQGGLDGRKWRDVRLELQLFTHLAISLPRPIISPSSLLQLFESLTAVLDDPFLRANRADSAVKVIGNAMLRFASSGPLDLIPGALKDAGDWDETVMSGFNKGIGVGVGLGGEDPVKLESEVMGLKEKVRSYVQGREWGVGEAKGKDEWWGIVGLEDPIDSLCHSLFQTQTSPPSVLPLTTETLPSNVLPSTADSDSADNTTTATTAPVPLKPEYEPLTLPTILVPPEDEEDTTGAGIAGPAALQTGDDQVVGAALAKDADGFGYEGVRVHLKVFQDETVPAPGDPSGEVIRQLIRDIIEIYQVNRKECARILLDLGKWCRKGTFRNQKGWSKTTTAVNGGDLMAVDEDADGRNEADGNVNGNKEDTDGEAPDGPQWSLENLIIEMICSIMFSLPAPARTQVYYHALVSELCRLSPNTIAPPLGKCFRRLYEALGENENSSLDANGVRRFADWFAIHLSNFGFLWGWKEWESDLGLPGSHPKRVFLARVLDICVRLSYHDRIMHSIPTSYLEASPPVMPATAASGNWPYDPTDIEGDGKSAEEFLELIRAKETMSQLQSWLRDFKKELVNNGVEHDEAEKRKVEIAIRSIMNIGSRSFSHFLNVLERYLNLIRTVTSTPEGRLLTLRAVSSYFATNNHFTAIVFDKLLQYRVVDPIDVVRWCFDPLAGTTLVALPEDTPPESLKALQDWSNVLYWDVLRDVTEKVNARVKVSKARLESLKRAEMTKKDQERAAGQGQPDEAFDLSEPSPEVTQAARLFEQLQKEQGDALVTTMKYFAESLTLAKTQGDMDEWVTWWLKGWHRQFCRQFAREINAHDEALSAGLSMVEDPESKQLQDLTKGWVDFVGRS